MVSKWLLQLLSGDPAQYQRQEPTSRRLQQAPILTSIKSRSFGTEDFSMPIVGESHYLDALRRAKTSVKDYAGTGYIYVHLKREPENPYDSDAIKVMNDQDETLGYLSRTNAQKYQQAFELWECQRYAIRCKAKLVGGERGRPNIGAWLDLAPPKEIVERFHNPRMRK